MSHSLLCGNSPLSLVTDFAAHLAFLLNTGNGQTELNFFSLQTTLLRTLTNPSNRRLIGAGLFDKCKEPEEVAQRYFDAVVDRRLMLARANHTHKGHEFYLALCRRGIASGWSGAELTRNNARPGTAHDAPCDFASVAARLGKVDKSITVGNPAAKTREAAGPLNVVAAAGHAEVAEELSVWKAICCSPLKQRILQLGPPFDAFCSIVIKVVEAANAPFGTILSLGLSPYDWGDELSTNTAKKLGSFLTDVRRETPGTSSGRGDLDTWRNVWLRRQVPGYTSADDLWRSELGRAIRFPVAYEVVPLDEVHTNIIRDGEVMDSVNFQAQLAEARTQGVLDDFDMWLYGQLHEGASLAELKERPEAITRFGSAMTDLGDYVEGLTGRVLEWARQHLDLPDDGHPDNDTETPEST